MAGYGASGTLSTRIQGRLRRSARWVRLVLGQSHTRDRGLQLQRAIALMHIPQL